MAFAAQSPIKHVLDYLKEKLAQLLNSVLDPIWRWVLGLSWALRALVLVLIVCVGLALEHREFFVKSYREVSQIVQVLRAPEHKIPINAETLAGVKDVVSRISKTLEPELKDPDRLVVNAFVTAQLIMGVGTSAGLDANVLQLRLRNARDSSCGCWRELSNQKEMPPNIYISGWILAALASLQAPATSSEVEFLTSEQNSGGWWSVFPVAERPEYASTYGTAWATLGLQSQIDRGLLSVREREVASNAVQRATAWLLTNRLEGARWKNYPLAPSGRSMLSVSALALHVLHDTQPTATMRLDREWLDALPTDALSSDAKEAEYNWITSKDGYHLDAFEHIPLPWLLIATVDAYPAGDLRERARALEWLEVNLNQPTIRNADTQRDDWWRAELLYALRHVLERIGP